MRIKIEDRPGIDLPVRDIYGLVVDIGTTTVVIYLLNLSTGEELDLQSFHNPQWKFGADVLSRIVYTEKSGSTQEVQAVLIRELNQAIVRLSSRNKISLKDIYRVLVVGNTIMLHFFLGIDPQSMARAPYNPVFTEKRRISPDKVKLKINQKGIVETLPVVSAFIGADIIADLLLIDMDIDEEWKLLIDIGTNGEIVLGNKEQLLACSVAAGPAFEGASISYGTAGIPGAISSFRINKNKEFLYETINSEPVIGICGSGLIDIVAEFLDKGVLTETGLFSERLEPEILNKLIYHKNMKALKIAGDDQSPILLTQKDVRELQLAKGAIAAGINILLKEAGINDNDLKKVYLAGGFGEYINIDNAIKIGLLPVNSKEKVYRLGNGAGIGARVYLLDPKQEARVNYFSKKIEYLELSLRNDFQREFINSLDFPDYSNHIF